MQREAFLYRSVKLLNSSLVNRNNFGSGEVHFNLTGTYMNDPFILSSSFPDIMQICGVIELEYV